jgi:hypothetical protein
VPTVNPIFRVVSGHVRPWERRSMAHAKTAVPNPALQRTPSGRR